MGIEVYEVDRSPLTSSAIIVCTTDGKPLPLFRCARLHEMRERLCEEYIETEHGTAVAHDRWSKYNAACTDCILANEELAKATIASMPAATLEDQFEASLRAVRICR